MCCEPSKQVGPRLRMLSHLIELAIGRKLSDQDLTSTQSFIIHYLWERQEETVYPKDIEKRFHLTHPTVSGILQRLEMRNFIQTQPDPHDRRCRQIVLAPKGLAIHQEVGTLISAMESAMTTGMSDLETQQLLVLLDRAYENLTTFIQKEEFTP